MIKFYMSRIKKWIKNEKNQKKAVEFLIPIVLFLLRAIAQKTKNTHDDKVVKELEMWYNVRKNDIM